MQSYPRSDPVLLFRSEHKRQVFETFKRLDKIMATVTFLIVHVTYTGLK